MIRIPTGRIPQNTARVGSFVLGVATLAASLFFPQYSRVIAEVGGLLTALGLTLGKQ